MKRNAQALVAAAACLTPATPCDAAPSPHLDAPATHAINTLGWQLLTQSPAQPGNTLLSPFSIQLALAMTFAGADGQTREEMARALHYEGDEEALHRSFANLQRELLRPEAPTPSQASPRPNRPTYTLQLANRLFADTRQTFRPTFLDRTRDTYRAPLEPVDFFRSSTDARTRINGWVEDQTRQRIRDLLPPDAITRDTRLVLVNALYLKAAWRTAFPAHATQPRPFHVHGGASVDVPTLSITETFGFLQNAGYRVVTVPYAAGGLQFIVILPEAPDGLAALETQLSGADFAHFTRTDRALLHLSMPKLKLEPPAIKLGQALRELGMKTAFDQPPGSANFDRMAARTPADYLSISEVFHKTFLELDEQGTEAAAATAVVMKRTTSIAPKPPRPIEVRIDHPFLFAIQHRPSGACLFLGRITDPRTSQAENKKGPEVGKN